MAEAKLADLVARLEKVAVRLESVGAGSSSDAPVEAGAVAAFVTAYDELMKSSLTPLLEVSKTIGGDVATVGDLIQKAFAAEREFLVAASKVQKPAPAVLQQLAKPVTDAVQSIGEFRSKNRGPFPNHLAALSEGMPALGWIFVEKTPAPYVKDMHDASQFWLDKVLREFKGKDDNHVSYVKLFKALLTDLQDYVKQNHTTGVTWNPKGQDAASYKGDAAPAPAKVEEAKPTPAPAAAPAGKPPGMGGLFSELNAKGEGVTSGLKRVTADMKTKNMTDRPSVVPAAAEKKPAASTPSAPAQKPRGPPRIELDGKKWIVENYEGNQQIVLDEVDLKQAVYITKCDNSVIQIKGKFNSVVLDGCKKTGLVFENAVASCEVVNCTGVQVQITGFVPSVAIDKTSGCQLFLSQDGLRTEIVSSKSSEMNIVIPNGDDVSEMPIPEQYLTKWDETKKKFITAVSSHV